MSRAESPRQVESLPHEFLVSAHRFTFRATDRIAFPAVAANTLRGALGVALRESAHYFRPTQEKGPSGFADPPRPFVLRAASLNHKTLAPGDCFAFDLHLFDLDPHALAIFTSALGSFAREGLGRSRGRAQLQTIHRLRRDRSIAQGVDEDTAIAIDLKTDAGARRIAIEFLTPTELKHEGAPVDEPSFAILFARVRDRLCALSRFYGGGDLDLPLAELSKDSTEVRLVNSSVIHRNAERRSSRTGQRHPLGGFTGTAVYEGNLGRFLPWLEAAYWTGVGRQTVWGKGVIDTTLVQ